MKIWCGDTSLDTKLVAVIDVAQLSLLIGRLPHAHVTRSAPAPAEATLGRAARAATELFFHYGSSCAYRVTISGGL